MALGTIIGRAVLSALVALPLAAAVWLAALAIGLLEAGPPGADLPRGELLLGLGFWALLFGGPILIVTAASSSVTAALGGRLLAFVGLAAGCFLAAYYAAYDPYFMPDIADMEPGYWDRWYALAGLGAVAASLLTWKRPRLGSVATGALLLYSCGLLVISTFQPN